MRLGIVGSRRRNSLKDKELIKQEILKLKPDVLISGGCPKGADRFVEELSEELKIPIIIYYPKEVKKGSPYFKYVQSFFERNKQIVESSDKLIALVSNDRKGGTENTIKHMKKLKKPIMII